MQGMHNGTATSGLHEADWQASRHADPTEARVELAVLPGGAIAMRHSHHPGGPALIYTYAEIEAFIAGAKDGDFDDLIA